MKRIVQITGTEKFMFTFGWETEGAVRGWWVDLISAFPIFHNNWRPSSRLLWEKEKARQQGLLRAAEVAQWLEQYDSIMV